ncbi:ATP-binding protein [Acidipila rosea]|uniref:Histidine kinase/DNA gyrase B/HSP90-like ATPase n=1 Tax=Acidipila rosea TaxID=768535 RepID=A0A4R1KUU0_9BACT|nr:ATP-binding protein [Acidipila rosea]TCK68457.1 histidine kinase/DNA gyrase B/HSP90-like ATPase [Acidipila rosea]
MPIAETAERLIDAEPTKQFFVDMITRDIQLEQAVLDLVDNSVDGAQRYRGTDPKPLDGFEVTITVDANRFKIFDNCGGFDKETARDYAFRFGRPAEKPMPPHSIGQFGVGMKRALFKFGRHFMVQSSTEDEEWAVDVDVIEWEGYKAWTFPWAEFPETPQVSKDEPGTLIVVDKLRPEVSARFGTEYFVNAIIGLIKSKHRQFIADGLSISVNGHHISATSLNLLITGSLRPGVDKLSFNGATGTLVNARIVVGIGESIPRDAGWYVVCNGRVILEADRRAVTGWGLVESEASKTSIPTFHNQYARFRGVVWFDSADSGRVPWNTTKTDVDQESPIWQKTFLRMVEMMRPVIDFMNELDREVEEQTKESSTLLGHLSHASRVNTETLQTKTPFTFPRRGDIAPAGPTMVKIQFSRPLPDIDFLANAFGLSSAKAVGERCFDLALRKQRDN